MRDIIQEISSWLESDTDFVNVTVVKTWGSGPRKTGAGMAINKKGEILGSVSGGCVEGDVIKRAQEVFNTGKSELVHYGVTDDEAWEVGLSCGGQIEILLELVNDDNRQIWQQVANDIIDNQGAILASPIDGGSSQVAINPHKNDSEFLNEIALEAYGKRKSGVYPAKTGDYFINVFPRRSELIIVGAAHISAELVEQASLFGFETTLIDPRGLFTNNTQFKVQPSHSYNKWPEEILQDRKLDSDVYAVMLTHDPKIDDQALHILLRSNVAYIGALGSKKTHAKRVSRLSEAGFSEEEIAKIHAPIGVSINAQYPAEIALSIVAELIKTRNQFL